MAKKITKSRDGLCCNWCSKWYHAFGISNVKVDINKCNELIHNLDIATKTKIKAVENKSQINRDMIEIIKNHNEILQKRLNRCDFIINGLPRNHPNLTNVVQHLFNHLGVEVNNSDINVCFFINNGNSVLVKLNSMYKRDAIMGSYFKT